jgi:hypothetical protein
MQHVLKRRVSLTYTYVREWKAVAAWAPIGGSLLGDLKADYSYSLE